MVSKLKGKWKTCVTDAQRFLDAIAKPEDPVRWPSHAAIALRMSQALGKMKTVALGLVN